jgi:beta-1,4-N-acetylglucosaminyltransferase
MIFVTVGTHSIGFERLVKKMDEIANKTEHKVVIQTGTTNYEPKNAEWFKFRDYEDIINIIKSSDIIICHGGAGTLLDILNLNKPIIVVPRRKKFNEVHDDHEIELAESLKKTKNVTIIYYIENLEEAINELNLQISNNVKVDKNLVKFLKKYLRNST